MNRIPAVDIDFRVLDGSVVVLWPVSDAAIAWADEHIVQDGPRWGGGIVVEPRYVQDIVDGAIEDGLVFGRFSHTPERSS